MYAIKSNKERIDVRHYSSAFIPSYTSAAENSMGKRLYVVPGYIFMMTKAPGAEKVPDTDWKVIEAISDSHPSTLDVKAKKIIDGPLTGLLILRVNPALKSVCIRAKLLGVTRDYWLAVRFKSAEEKADDGKAADVVELKEKQQEGKKMAKTTYTEEQINQAIERAKEIGIHAAGQELGIPWQAVQGFCKKAGVMDEASKKPAKKKTTTPVAEEKAEKKAEKPEKKTKKAKTAEAPAKQKKAAAAPVAEEKPKKAAPAAPAAPAASTAPASKPAEKTEPATDLAIENAVLRKENEQLKAKIEKLQKALADLI